MKNHLTLAVFGIALIATPALAQVNPPPMISVSGEGTVSVPPDLAVVDGGVTTDAKTAREAAEANNAAMAKVLAALKSAGIAEKDMQTSRLSLFPQYTQQTRPNPNPGPNVISGYRASNRVTIRVRDVTKVAGTIDALVASGANEVGGINFMVTKASQLLDDARSEAVADARRKAEIYAKAAGVKLGAPISISEDSGSAPAPMMLRKMGADAASAPVAQGEEVLRVNVSVSWEIKPAQ
ncbi:SIMPL domain-containing protein [Tardiphaga sp. 768_D3_N2_1]|uniref:SIMPL domain-containing protein n=1 Tax=Tardiphaga sp. 768_D3_N2_1 TaxID=3240783 RepID=UPI003F8BF866